MTSLPEPIAGTSPVAPSLRSPLGRSTVRDSWAWLWPDSLRRLLPFAVATAIYAAFWGGGAAGVGLIAPNLPRDLLVGGAIGIPLTLAAIAYRRWIEPWHRLPTPSDQALQTTYYLVFNAPVEELFWRGMVQTLAIRAVALLLGAGGIAGGIGWALTTTVFGAYHRLGNWSWRRVAGVTAAGGIFGLAYLLQPAPRDIWLPIIIHGPATAGFLSWGDAALHWWSRRARRSV